MTPQGTSAGTDETGTGSGLQPAGPVANGDAPERPTARDWQNRAERAEAECKELREMVVAGTFLLARLDELEWLDGQLEDTARDYMGHVDPAIARFRNALQGESNGQ